MRRIVVVGNGIAGLTACDSLRSAGFDGELTVVGAEVHRPYSRPALSKALLHGEEGSTAHELPQPTHGARELRGVSAVGLDPDRRTVRLADGDLLPYDGLVIASGSRARKLTPPGQHGAAEVTLRTVEDAVALRKRVAARPSVLVIGGGALGMEVASGCLEAGCEVTLVSDGQPLVRQLGGYLAGIFAAAAARRGLRLVPGSRAALVQQDGGARVVLADGTVLEAELVVTAVGDEPNTEWLAGTGLLTDGMLQTDSRGRVRADRVRPDIVAAGDVACFPGRFGAARVPLWTSAIDQARTAAGGLLYGDDAPELDFQPYFWTEGFGLSLKAVGPVPPAGPPSYREAGNGEDSMLLRWDHPDGSGTSAALNYRIPVPKLRRLANGGPGALPAKVPARL